MKHRELELFAAICRSGSVTAAAAAVGMSQPAASAMLRQLEDRLGYGLFTRDRRRMELTASARALLPEVTNALAALNSVSRLASSMNGEKGKRLVIGAVSSVGASILPEAVRVLQKSEPGVSVVLLAGTALEVIHMAAEERIELGVILGSGGSVNVGFKHLADLPLICVMRADHPLCNEKVVTPTDLAGTTYIGHSRHLPVGAITAQALEAAGHEFAPSIEVMQFSAACAFVEAGGGVAVLEGLSAMYAEKHGLVARPLIADSDLSLNLVWPLNRGLSKLATALSAQLTELVAHVTPG